MSDIYMQAVSGNNKLLLLQTFMEAVYRGDFARGNTKEVKGTTAREALGHVCAVLEKSGWGNPSKTPAGKLKLTLGQQ
eukprot:7470486-Ditylum_brightwellii.AAC.1